MAKAKGAPHGNQNAKGTHHVGHGRPLPPADFHKGLNAGLAVHNGILLGALAGGKAGGVAAGPHGMAIGVAAGAAAGLATYHGLNAFDKWNYGPKKRK